MSKYLESDIVQCMYENNVLFYKETEEQQYDIYKFARKMLRKRWNGLSVVRFLAFGARGGYNRGEIWETLDEEYPELEVRTDMDYFTMETGRNITGEIKWQE